MEPYDLSHKLSFAGRRSPVPFATGPEYLNSVPGVPVLSQLRVFIPRDLWNRDNVFVAAREICRVLGSTSQFDIGMTQAGTVQYDENRIAAGDTARLMKLDAESPRVVLLLRGSEGDRAYEARYPRLQFEEAGEDYWRSVYAPGATKVSTQL
jgi:hypothetical protein